MNRKLQTALFVALTSMFSLHLCAQTPVKAHSFGGHIATGGIEFNDSEDDGDGVVQIYGFYNYAFTKYFALEVGLNVGADVDEWDCYEDRHDDWHCSTNNRSLFGLGVDEVEYSNLVTAIKGVVPISQRNSLYAKVGAQFYEYELSDGSQILHDDDGTGLYLAVGWQYVWDMGIGMNAGFERYNMGDLVSTAANIGISYSF
ncbi:outer membrane beta-barrel protein [Paraglaciecola aquimarina]|uniref:Outer membrane beta-barrel protein n=1 Tax=Paraglaciecola aquimarina TaxID=1235557 RepID=A0ABU3SVE3_9ALTE|nr:outer membrane beta-barrel protein [Paraglaciecola aquimarina]MDU0353986.1 outer membrane beta-barrel protein [Paraglaciecola aquimarina]